MYIHVTRTNTHRCTRTYDVPRTYTSQTHTYVRVYYMYIVCVLVCTYTCIHLHTHMYLLLFIICFFLLSLPPSSDVTIYLVTSTLPPIEQVRHVEDQSFWFLQCTEQTLVCRLFLGPRTEGQVKSRVTWCYGPPRRTRVLKTRRGSYGWCLFGTWLLRSGSVFSGSLCDKTFGGHGVQGVPTLGTPFSRKTVLTPSVPTCRWLVFFPGRGRVGVLVPPTDRLRTTRDLPDDRPPVLFCEGS